MSLFQTAWIALDGTAGSTANGASAHNLAVLFALDHVSIGGGLFQYKKQTTSATTGLTPAGAPTVGDIAGPCTADTTDNAATTLNGTTQGWDLGVIAGFVEAMAGNGLTICAWIKGTNITQQKSILGIWNGGARYTGGGFEMSFGTSVISGAANTAERNIFCTGIDAAGGTVGWGSVAENIGNCIDDGIWHCLFWHIRRVDATHVTLTCHLDDSVQTVTQQYAAGSAGALTTTGHVVVGGYSTGATPVFTYNDPVGPIGALVGQLTQAQRRTIMLAGPPSVNGIPMVAMNFRGDTGTLDALNGNAVIDGAIVGSFRSAAADLTQCLNTGSTGGPKLVVANNGNKAALSFDNLYRTSYFQTVFNAALSGVNKINPNRLTIAVYARQAANQVLGGTSQDLVNLNSSADAELATLRVGASASYHLNYGNNAIVYYDSTKPFARIGPGGVFLAATYDQGVLTLYQDGETGFVGGQNGNAAGAAPAQRAVLASKLYLGGVGALSGSCFYGLIHEIVISRSAATAAEIATLRAGMIGRWGLGQESTTSDIEVIGAGDSIMTGQDVTVDCNSWWMRIARANMGPRWCFQAYPGYTSSSILGFDWTATSKVYVAGVPSKSFLIYALSINDIHGSVLAADWWTNVTTLLDRYRAVRPNGTIFVMGPTTGDGAAGLSTRNSYRDAALAGLPSYGTNAYYVDLEGMDPTTMFNVDAIHPNDPGHAYIRNVTTGALNHADPVGFPARAATGSYVGLGGSNRKRKKIRRMY